MRVSRGNCGVAAWKLLSGSGSFSSVAPRGVELDSLSMWHRAIVLPHMLHSHSFINLSKYPFPASAAVKPSSLAKERKRDIAGRWLVQLQSHL